VFDSYLQGPKCLILFVNVCDCRLKELQVLDIKFLYGCSKPTIALLYKDNKDTRHLKTYEVQVEEFIEGTWFQNNLDNGAGLLIPIPLPLGGVIIIGEQTICYCNASAAFVEIPIQLVKGLPLLGLLNSNENIGIKCKPNVESLRSCFSSTDHLVADKFGSHIQNMYTYVLFDPDVTHTWFW
jgi:hypothetical protein